MDYEIGRLLDYLDSNPQFADTAIVVVSDHGEAFGEHQEWTQGNYCFESTMAIPLLVKAPGHTSGINS